MYRVDNALDVIFSILSEYASRLFLQRRTKVLDWHQLTFQSAVYRQCKMQETLHFRNVFGGNLGNFLWPGIVPNILIGFQQARAERHAMLQTGRRKFPGQ